MSECYQPKICVAIAIHESLYRWWLLYHEQREGWELPGGKVHPDETVTAAAVRELREETGLVCEPDELHFVGVVREVQPEDYLTFVFSVRRPTDQLPRVMESQVHRDIQPVHLALTGNPNPHLISSRCFRQVLEQLGVHQLWHALSNHGRLLEGQPPWQ